MIAAERGRQGALGGYRENVRRVGSSATRCAGAEVAGKGSRGRGVNKVKAEAEEDAGEHDAGSKLRDSKGRKDGARELSGLGSEGCVRLGEGFVDLAVELAGGVEDEALQDEADGVERRGHEENREAGEQAEARAEARGDAGFVEARGVDAETDDGRGDEPEERKQRDGRQREGEHGEGGRDGSCEAGDLDGSAPDDGVAGSDRLEGLFGERMRGSFSRADLLVDLVTELFGELHLGCSAIPAIDEGAFFFAMKDGVATGTKAGTHYFQG